ncbi:MAG: EAL domain-containing protein, partial [Chromatiales bacterium]|nr:EAL domain-containing protein [Chromatiales bacterium]
RVRQRFREYEISPTCIEFEITESTLMEDPTTTVEVLNEFYAMGVNLAIDDFGTGYSSLSSLQRFPINTLKIDRSFVRDADIDRDDATIVSTIIEMGRTLNMDVVAEGVETEGQLNFLRQNHCHYVQGHLLGGPLTADEYLELLRGDKDGSGRHRALFAVS